MAMIAVRRFVPPAACNHEPTMVDGQWACVLCGAYVAPAPKPDARTEHQLARAIACGDHVAELFLRQRLAAPRPMDETELRAAWGDR